MKEIIYKRADTLEELEQIRALQLQNSLQTLTTEEQQNEGFVTVQHSISLLEKMNAVCAHIIAKEGDSVVGYALVMLSSFRNEVEVLVPMFERIDSLLAIGATYVVVGQICVDKKYRKQGVFRGLYHFYRSELQDKFEYLITDVAVLNVRSMNAHESVGFKTIDSYEKDSVFWNIILWDWK